MSHFAWNSPITTSNFFVTSTISLIIGLGIFALFIRYLAREDRRVRGLPTPREQRALKKAAKQNKDQKQGSQKDQKAEKDQKTEKILDKATQV